MDPQLTLETMGTLAGVVVFIELMVELFVKRALRRFADSPDYGLVLNAITVLLAFAGSVGAQAARLQPVNGSTMMEIILRCIEATGIAIGGYEGVKHSARFVKSKLAAWRR